jgi:hypothetical protein
VLGRRLRLRNPNESGGRGDNASCISKNGGASFSDAGSDRDVAELHGDDAELHRFDAWNEIAEQARGEGKERGEERGEEGCRCPKTGNRRERVGGGGKAGGVAACLAIGSEAAGEATGNKAAG